MSYQSQLDKLMQMATIEQLNLLMKQFNNTNNTTTNTTNINNTISKELPEILSLPIVQKVVLAYEKELQDIKDKSQKNNCKCCCQCDDNVKSYQPTPDILEVSKVIDELHKSCSESFFRLEERLNEVASCVDKLMSVNTDYKSFVVVDEPYIKIEKVDKVETSNNTVLPIIKEPEHSKEPEHIKLEIVEKVIPDDDDNDEELESVKDTETEVIDIHVPIVDKLLSNIAEVNDTVVEEEIIEEEDSEDEEVSEEEVATDVSEEDIKEIEVVKVQDEEVVQEVVDEEVVEDEDVEDEDVEDEDVEDDKKVNVEEEEEDDEEVFEIEIDDVTYYATDEENGILYEVTKTGDVGKKVGIIKDGEPIFS